MSTAPTNADQRSTGQTPGLHPVLLLPVNGAPQGEDDLSQDKAASPISGGAAEDLFDDQEDDSASEYDDALSWFNEADVLWTKEQLAAAGTPMASTSEEAAENMIREPMVSVERDGERPWYAKIEPEDYHGLPHHDVASIIIEEESEEEEEPAILESLPALQSKSHTASHWPLDTTASLKTRGLPPENQGLLGPKNLSDIQIP
ncbi:hypothetical protein BKA70DRAFT_1437198 [Coprinopsis sp. MPI-PUGE-AT-0042]|nr:hypothetical protein BKA70DRAFT_1437198 [Coprinopsis sp. MPI-PUGE-AT-0042]